MKFEFEQTVEDIINFNQFQLENSEVMKSSIFKQRIALVAMYSLVVLFFIRSGIVKSDITIIIIYSIVCSFLFFRYNKYVYWRSKRAVRKMLAEGKNKSMIGKQSLTFTAESITDKNEYSSTEFKYSLIEKFRENEDYFFLYTSALQAILVKKELFETKEKIAEFKDFILDKMHPELAE
ncbi:MAG: YcxB family protein [Leptospirales bacterium]